jgi:urease accessory protein
MIRKPGDLPTQSFATTSSGGGRMGDYMNLRPLPRRAPLLALALSLAATPAFAHHVMGGKTPSTVMEGLLSGLGHPVIGPDHLAFLVALGIVVGVGGLNLALPALFVAAMAVGVMVHVNGIDLPAPELIVAVSVLLAGALIAVGRALPVVVWSALFLIAGLFHGYAFGESIVGAETAPLDGYLVGLVVSQTILTVGTAFVARRLGMGISGLAPRLVGAVIVAVGLATLALQVVPGA